MFGVFLYLWRLTESMAINGIYYAVNYTSVIFSFIIGGGRSSRMIAWSVTVSESACMPSFICPSCLRENIS